MLTYQLYNNNCHWQTNPNISRTTFSIQRLTEQKEPMGPYPPPNPKSIFYQTMKDLHHYVYQDCKFYCTIGPTFCAVKKEVRRKRNTQTRR